MVTDGLQSERRDGQIYIHSASKDGRGAAAGKGDEPFHVSRMSTRDEACGKGNDAFDPHFFGRKVFEELDSPDSLADVITHSYSALEQGVTVSVDATPGQRSSSAPPRSGPDPRTR